MKNSLKNYDHAEVLGKINQKIRDWELEPLIGRGLVSRMNGGRCAYAHIELNIHKGEEKHSSSVIWSTEEHQIPFNFGQCPDCGRNTDILFELSFGNQGRKDFSYIRDHKHRYSYH